MEHCPFRCSSYLGSRKWLCLLLLLPSYGCLLARRFDGSLQEDGLNLNSPTLSETGWVTLGLEGMQLELTQLLAYLHLVGGTSSERISCGDAFVFVENSTEPIVEVGDTRSCSWAMKSHVMNRIDCTQRCWSVKAAHSCSALGLSTVLLFESWLVCLPLAHSFDAMWSLCPVLVLVSKGVLLTLSWFLVVGGYWFSSH